MKINTLVFGGSFDPIHNGHLRLLGDVRRLVDPGAIVVIPAFTAPHRNNKKTVSAFHRLAMVKLALEALDVEVSSLEIDRGGPSYTYDTVKALAELRGGTFGLLLGDDLLDQIEDWYRATELFSLVVPVIAGRNGKRCDTPLLKDALYLDNEPLAVSSTEIRDLVVKKGEVGHLLPEPVYRYIKDHGLYSQ